jgi:hypothetical protein
VEFVEEKKEKTVFAITLATGIHSGRILGRFWVSSTFWSHWSRFQSHWRPFAGVFASGKLSGPLGPFQCLELFGGYAQPFLVIQKPCSANFDLLNLMAEVSEPFEAIFTSKFSIED